MKKTIIGFVSLLSVVFVGCGDSTGSSSVNEQKVSSKAKVHQPCEVSISTTKGVAPCKVKLSVHPNDTKISMYYFSFGKKEFMKKSLPNNTIEHTFEYEGKYNVVAAIKDMQNNIIEKKFVVTVRQPTFEEYKQRQNKEFEDYKKGY